MFLTIWTCRTKVQSKRVNLKLMVAAIYRVRLPLAVCSRIGFLWISRMHLTRAELKTPSKSSKSSRWTSIITKWTHNDPRTIPLVPIAISNKTKLWRRTRQCRIRQPNSDWTTCWPTPQLTQCRRESWWRSSNWCNNSNRPLSSSPPSRLQQPPPTIDERNPPSGAPQLTCKDKPIKTMRACWYKATIIRGLSNPRLEVRIVNSH